MASSYSSERRFDRRWSIAVSCMPGVQRVRHAATGAAGFARLVESGRRGCRWTAPWRDALAGGAVQGGPVEAVAAETRCSAGTGCGFGIMKGAFGGKKFVMAARLRASRHSLRKLPPFSVRTCVMSCQNGSPEWVPRLRQISNRTSWTGRVRSCSAISSGVGRAARSSFGCGVAARGLRGLREDDVRSVYGRSGRSAWGASFASSASARRRPRVMRARIRAILRVPNRAAMSRRLSSERGSRRSVVASSLPKAIRTCRTSSRRPMRVGAGGTYVWVLDEGARGRSG